MDCRTKHTDLARQNFWILGFPWRVFLRINWIRADFSWSSDAIICWDNESSLGYIELRRLSNAVKSRSWFSGGIPRGRSSNVALVSLAFMSLEMPESGTQLKDEDTPNNLGWGFLFREKGTLKDLSLLQLWNWVIPIPYLTLQRMYFKPTDFWAWQGSLFCQKTQGACRFPVKGWKASAYTKQNRVFLIPLL